MVVEVFAYLMGMSRRDESLISLYSYTAHDVCPFVCISFAAFISWKLSVWASLIIANLIIT